MEINTVYNEDCLITMGNMDDNYIDLTVTSPPYDDLRTYDDKYSFEFEAVARELFRVTKVGGVVVWIVGDQTINGNESGTSFRQALYFRDVCGFNLHDTMIYLKSPRGGVGAQNTYWPQFEYMFVLVKGKLVKFHMIKDRKNTIVKRNTSTRRRPNGSLIHPPTFRRRANGEFDKERSPYQIEQYGKRTNVWKYQTGFHNNTKDTIAYGHPAIMHEGLVRDHILSWSDKGDLIYDPFMGSGTTAKMAAINDRVYVGEINEEYYELAKKRLSNCNTLSKFQKEN